MKHVTFQFSVQTTAAHHAITSDCVAGLSSDDNTRPDILCMAADTATKGSISVP
jgi:hypothetical protein